MQPAQAGFAGAATGFGGAGGGIIGQDGMPPIPTAVNDVLNQPDALAKPEGLSLQEVGPCIPLSGG